MERKLEKGETPKKGKMYKRIAPTSSYYTVGKIYIGEGDGKLTDDFSGNHSWSTEGVFYEKFVEVVEENKIIEGENERKLMFPETTGVKHDQNKLPLFTIIFKQFPLAIQAVAKRALAGHNKYIETDTDWQNFARAGEQDPDRYKNAGMRHMLEEGEDKEEGMEGTTHEAAVVWNFLADLECKLRREKDEKLSK